MIDEIRRPTLIQKELSHLGELIRDNIDLISLYPDRFSLQLHLTSLKDREKVLLKELQQAYNRLQIDTFDWDIEGEFIENYRISVR